MNVLQILVRWLDIRPNEVRTVTISFLSAFLVVSFLVLARSLREALYLTAFDVKTLPYITAAVAVLSVPTVGLFARLLARYQPRNVLTGVVLLIGAGLAALVPFATRVNAGVVAFYLWTALGTLLVTSGFWVVTSEHFPVRGAKRLFGLIGAGGTAGAMVMGNSLIFLTKQVELVWLTPGLIGLLVLFFAVQSLMPKLPESSAASAAGEEKSSIRESFGLAWQRPHLRTIAMIVFTANIATTLLDYQFKELVQADLTTGEQLASFFGAFYGWTGLISLVIQLVVAARFMSMAGIGLTLAFLPSLLLLGSVGLLVVPSLVLVTLVRGGDTSIRKSLHRSVMEVLYVPVPSNLRRKTKTFIDSVVDAVADGLGAGIVFLWVTLSGFPSRYLSVYIILLATVFLYLSRRMGRQYFATVTEELKIGGEESEEVAAAARLAGRDLLSATFTRLDMQSLLKEAGVSVEGREDERAEPGEAKPVDVLEQLRSPDLQTVARALEETTEWDDSHVPAVTRLLARDPLYDRVLLVLLLLGDRAVPHLTELLRDETTDFSIRRRIPRVLARMGGQEADACLLDSLAAKRFEVRYRSAIALVRRRRKGLPKAERDHEPIVWDAVRVEVSRDRAVWELQKLLDSAEPDDDELVTQRVDVRGELSLEHTFRLMSLVLDPEPVRAAFHGVILEDENLKSFSLEYLEQALPTEIRKRLWPFIGDVSEYQREKALRPIDEVVSDLMTTGATLFADEEEREALKRIIEQQEEE